MTAQQQQQQQEIIIKSLLDTDILCGRCKTAFHNKGNVSFRLVIASKIPSYLSAKSRKEKSAVIISISEHLQDVVGARFLKPVKGGYSLLSEMDARKKVGHAIRDMTVAKSKTTMTQHTSINTTATTSSPQQTKNVVFDMISSKVSKSLEAIKKQHKAEQSMSKAATTKIVLQQESREEQQEQVVVLPPGTPASTRSLQLIKESEESRSQPEQDSSAEDVSSLKTFLLEGSTSLTAPFLPAPRSFVGVGKSFGGKALVVTPENSTTLMNTTTTPMNMNTEEEEEDSSDMFDVKFFEAIEPLRASFQIQTLRRTSTKFGDFEKLEMDLLGSFDLKLKK